MTSSLTFFDSFNQSIHSRNNNWLSITTVFEFPHFNQAQPLSWTTIMGCLGQVQALLPPPPLFAISPLSTDNKLLQRERGANPVPEAILLGLYPLMKLDFILIALSYQSQTSVTITNDPTNYEWKIDTELFTVLGLKDKLNQPVLLINVVLGWLLELRWARNELSRFIRTRNTAFSIFNRPYWKT